MLARQDLQDIRVDTQVSFMYHDALRIGRVLDTNRGHKTVTLRVMIERDHFGDTYDAGIKMFKVAKCSQIEVCGPGPIAIAGVYVS